MASYTDQLGRNITLDHFPQRIISLVPSQTELLYYLSLRDETIGITKFCIHPDTWFRTKTRVGGTRDIKPDIVRKLQPDLIIANKEENQKDQVEALAQHYPVWVSDINNLSDALDMIRSVGKLTGRETAAISLADEIHRRFASLSLPSISPAPRTAYFIWRNPWMVAGGDVFIHDMLQKAGFDNIFGAQKRYPSIELETLARLDCKMVLLSSEPYPFSEKHIDEIRAVLPEADIRLVDGEMFSWYGSRLLEAPAYFQELRGRMI